MKLETYLTNKKLTQSEFAKLIGATQAAVNRYACRKRTPALHIIWKIEKVTEGAVTAKDWPAPARKKRQPKPSAPAMAQAS